RAWYVGYLGRPTPPSSAEVQWAVSALTAGASEESILSGLLGGTEFYNRAQTLTPVGSADERFIRSLFKVLLNRDPVGGEPGSWLAALAVLGRPGTALAILQAPEFRGGVVNGIYARSLQRVPASTDVGVWVNSSLDLTGLRVAFEGATEYFQL